ncbi:MAG: DUF2157 domain-containing protein [Endozoicomonas sp.]|uniref:DUF2157 domain-containing protein n=1 Tax=Endozoicomonas sp. TaxID=1892382 RepID=UPI003D9B0920
MRLIRLLKTDIAREASEWVADSLISEAQAEAICKRYDVDYHQVQSKSFAYSVLTGLAYLFIGLAVIISVGANWDDIPRGIRMGGLIALTMATQAFGIRKYLAGDLSGATGIFLLGNMFYGAAIILIAQIYHLGEHMPDGIFWWALGSLPFALLVKSPLLMWQSLLLAVIWFMIEAALGFYPALFPLFIASALYLLIIGKRSITLLLATVFSIFLWFEYTLSALWRTGLHLQIEAEHIVVSVALFIVLYAFSRWLHCRNLALAKDYGAVLALWSLRFGLVMMLIMSFESPWQELLDAEWDHQASMLMIAGILSGFALYLARYSGNLTTTVAIVSFYALTLIIVLAYPVPAVYLQVAYNLALIAAGIWLILKSIQKGISHYFFLGVSTILLTAFMRYVDLIGDYISSALLFIVCAALLLGAAEYWKQYQNKTAKL